MQHVREAGQGAADFEYVADGDNAHGGVGAIAHKVEPTELVAVQPETRGLSKKQALSAGIDSKEGQAGSILERCERLVEGEPL